ncbi:MAG: hypothetical protein ACRDSZ_09545 [Pseudonocardiaceae bacterium]
MAAIPDADGAQCAHCGVPRALLRAAVLGGLVIAGWLLGSGIAQACAFSGLDGVNEVQIASLSPLKATGTDEGPPGLLGVPPAVSSTVAGVMHAVPRPRLPVQPAQVPVLAPVLEPVSKLTAPVPKNAEDATGSRVADAEPAMVPPPAERAAPVAPATAAATPAPVLHAVSDNSSETPVCVAARPVVDQVAGPVALGPSALGNGPAAPVPAGPPATTTAPCSGGNAGGGSTTKSDHSVAFSDGWATTGPTPTLCRLCASASGIPPSAAQRPTTSPD